MNGNFFIGVFLLVIGILYGVWNLRKKTEEYPNTFTKVDSVNSWGISIILIVVGVIMIVKNV
ncbi:hypothetical protein ED312_08575 [Sinomicrobium pectinilyticum]|uniref:Uncharacterized protein n=1 Tax=Sinomicrobium pectinilyticum TaxID=1084421 RepID=A0A3N0EKQ9_SINP1|nr:hypothetical protein ED312_08575 [Sinomicrobium pectinilyticum]